MWIKVCGVTSVENALEVARAGVDAIGVNVWSGSKRSVSYAQARIICDALETQAPAVERVLLFVNASTDPDELAQRAAQSNASTIQLHGDEPVSTVRGLCDLGWPVIRALRVGEGDDVDTIRTTLDDLYAIHPARVRPLLDARVPHTWGGSGQHVHLPLARSLAQTHRFLLAGGLRPENLDRCAPLFARDRESNGVLGVDAASGVEHSPGMKNIARVQRFVDNVRSYTTSVR